MYILSLNFSLSRMWNDNLTLDQQLLLNRSECPPFYDLYTELDLQRIMSGFDGAFATGVACQQRTLTPPDTWFRPFFGGLHMLWLLKLVLPDLHQFYDIDTELDLYRITSGFHGAFATGVACQQGTLTLPDTWLRPPFWDLLVLQYWD